MLFDNQEDPFQLRNLAGEPGSRAIQEELDAGMRRWMAAVGDELAPVEALMARHGLAEAWAEREAFLHRGGNMSGRVPPAHAGRSSAAAGHRR